MRNLTRLLVNDFSPGFPVLDMSHLRNREAANPHGYKVSRFSRFSRSINWQVGRGVGRGGDFFRAQIRSVTVQQERDRGPLRVHLHEGTKSLEKRVVSGHET